MTPSRPYLLRAVREWILDNDMTPQVVVDAQAEGVSVPVGHVQDGRIVFNVSDSAVRGLQLGNDYVEFDARFGGKPFHVVLPIRAVLAVVARENGAGMSFPDDPFDDDPAPEPSPNEPKRPSLRVVK